MQPKRLMSKTTLTFLLLMPVKVLLSCLRSQVLLLLVSPLLTSCCMLWTVLRHRSCNQGPWSRNKFLLFVGNRISQKYLPPTENVVLFAQYFAKLLNRRYHCPNDQLITKSGPYSRIFTREYPFQVHCNENPVCVFLFWKLRDLSVPISTFMCL